MDKINFQNGVSGNTPLNATNLNKMQENVEMEFINVPKLIYSKIVGPTEIDGFTITGIELKDGNQYKIIVDGSLDGPYDDPGVFDLIARFNNETPTICRTTIFGTMKTSTTDGIQNVYATTEYLRILRGYIGYGCLSEVQLTYRNQLIRALGQYACFGNADNNVINQQIATMLGRYSGDITKIEIGLSSNVIKLSEGTIIKIYELP